MQRILKILIVACSAAIGCGSASATAVGCSTTREISDNLRLVKVDVELRARVELMTNIADCLMERSDAGTMSTVGDSIIDQLIDLLSDREDAIRNQAAIALGWFGPRAKLSVPALRRAYVRVESEVLSKAEVVPTSASDEGIVAALMRITGKPANQLHLPSGSDQSKEDGVPNH